MRHATWRSGLELLVALLAGLALRLSSRRVGVIVLYHRIGTSEQSATTTLVPTVSRQAFARQLRLLAATHRMVAPEVLLDATTQRRRGELIPVAVTFDDDLPSHVTQVAPGLASAKVPATFFLSGASLDGPHSFWWERLELAWRAQIRLDGPLPLGPEEWRLPLDVLADRWKQAPREQREEAASRLALLVPDDPEAGLRRDGVRALAAEFAVGFHTLRHDALHLLDDTALEQAMSDGRNELETVVGAPLASIAYPHGGADARVAEAARRAGFRHGFTTEPRAVRSGSPSLLLGRVEPGPVSLGRFLAIVEGTLLRG